MRGGSVVAAAVAGTAAFAVGAISAAVAGGAVARTVAVLDVALFAGGCVAFLVAFVRGVARSREEEVSVTTLYFLGQGTAPPQVRRLLLGALTVQVAVALGTAAARPYTSVAFGILVPVYGVGLAGLWGARHGRFPRRGEGGRRPGERGGGSAGA